MSRRILILSGLGVLVSGYYVFFKDRDDLIVLFSICLLIGVIGYIFQYQIDQLMIRGVPQKLDSAMRNMLFHTSAQFKKLHETHQKLVEDRMKRWVMKKDFIQKNEQDAPEDVKYIMAYYAILLTLHQQAYLYDGLDRVAFYHHPFLSPEHPDDVHIAEIELEDGTIIISVPHLIKGHLEKGYYNIGLHIMADAFQRLYLDEEIKWDDNIWEQLEEISGISRDSIEAYIGLPVDNPWPVAVHHQVIFQHARIDQVTSRLPQLTAFASSSRDSSSN
jgi:hypothetical protein